ncbi:hypothetical protein AB0L99_18910 [Streptomyces sp. NPDC051954]
MEVGPGDLDDEAASDTERRRRATAVERMRRMVADGEIDLVLIEKNAD